MTRELSALRPAGLQLLIAGLFLGGLLLLGSTGARWLIVPPPDVAAGEMLRALSAQREPAAHRELTRELREQVPPEQLPRLGAVSRIDATTVDEQPERATVRATLRLSPGEEHQVELPLVKEEGSWRVASLEPLRALAARP